MTTSLIAPTTTNSRLAEQPPGQGRQAKATAVWIVAVVAVIVGVVFRFSTLERKICQLDESGTMLFVSGYSVTDYMRTEGHEVTRQDLLKVQTFDPAKSNLDALRALARCLPDQAPLYYLVVRPLCQVAGSSLTTVRAVSATAGVVVIAATFWLCLEATSCAVFAAMAAAMVAVSPLQLVYSQQARPYAVWELLFLASSICLMRALRLNNRQNWVFYCIAATATAFTHLATCSVFCAQAAHTLYVERFRPTRRVMAFFTAMSVAVILLLPWLRFLIFGHSMFTASLRHQLTFGSLLRDSALNAASTFVSDGEFIANPWKTALRIAFALIVVCSTVVSLKSRKQQPLCAYLLLLCLSPSVLLLKYLQGGECLLTIDRYIAPALLSAQIMVAFALSQLWARPGKAWMPVSTALLITCIVIEVATCSWYAAQTDYRRLGVGLDGAAKVVRAAKNLLIVTDLGASLLLSHQDIGNARILAIGPNPDALGKLREPFLFVNGVTSDITKLNSGEFTIVPCDQDHQVSLVTPKSLHR